MIVCHCHVVSDRAVRAAVRAGASDVDEIGEHCGAGTSCGGCRGRLEQLVLVDQAVELPVAS